MELTIEHILPYASHNLKMRFMHPKEEFQKDGVLSSIHFGSGSYEDVKLYIDFSEGEHIWMYKPYLRPLSDLTKEIEHNGERFVPIEKLFDIETNLNWSESDYLVSEKGVNESWVRFNEKPSACFGYNWENKFFYRINKDSSDEKVLNQLDLWKKIYEWHFDIYNLIEKGLALDKNKLKQGV